MIISHKHRYLFIEIPHTASTAISDELREMYDGTKILSKHAHYFQFQQQATAEEKEYFVFASIRNPLDETVSKYFKLKHNHKERFTNPNRLLVRGGSVSKDNLRRFEFIRDNNADFAAYFKKFYRLPYSNIVHLTHQHCDFLMYFENLQEDFSKALELISIEQKRPLPQVNKTDGREKDYLSYYTPEIIGQAKRIFGPFMKKWGYDFPPEWGDASISWPNRLEFQAINFFSTFVWKYIRWSPHFYGHLFRQLR